MNPGGKLKAGQVVVLFFKSIRLLVSLTGFGFWFPHAILRSAVIPSQCKPSIQGALEIIIVGFLGKRKWGWPGFRTDIKGR